ncbi:MAG: nucleotide exchange factor GrpE [Ruminiclostridium sp.]|nr:nucleotide exchange factor GrpE [Ruminiclostridium sp.]
MKRRKKKLSEKDEEILNEETAEKVEEAEAAEVTVEPAEEAKEDPKDAQIAALKDQLMRNMAEYDNYRKRTAKEKTEMMPDITARVVSEFLPVLDNLERALAAECSDESYKKGVQMIYDSFNETLEKLGVEKVPAEDFDPSMHQAVQQVESADHESGKIVTVFQNGYRIGSKVLRFAMVSVAQ